MKTWLVFLLVAGAAFGQANAPDARAEALRQFPALGEAGSDFNLAFVAAVERLKATNPAFLSRDEWPLVLAYDLGSKLGVIAAARPGVVSIKEVKTDLPSFIGKPILIEAWISVNDYFNYSYAGSVNELYSFHVSDESGSGYVYGLRDGASPLRQTILQRGKAKTYGVFQVVISADRRHAEGEGFMADLLKIVQLYDKTPQRR